jgi:hypothetical protein
MITNKKLETDTLCNNSGTFALVCFISNHKAYEKKDIGYKMCTAGLQHDVGVGEQLQYQCVISETDFYLSSERFLTICV